MDKRVLLSVIQGAFDRRCFGRRKREEPEDLAPARTHGRCPFEHVASAVRHELDDAVVDGPRPHADDDDSTR